jgi:hypothetical protein
LSRFVVAGSQKSASVFVDSNQIHRFLSTPFQPPFLGTKFVKNNTFFLEKNNEQILHLSVLINTNLIIFFNKSEFMEPVFMFIS